MLGFGSGQVEAEYQRILKTNIFRLLLDANALARLAGQWNKLGMAFQNQPYCQLFRAAILGTRWSGEQPFTCRWVSLAEVVVEAKVGPEGFEPPTKGL